jgi:hypothetical protein
MLTLKLVSYYSKPSKSILLTCKEMQKHVKFLIETGIWMVTFINDDYYKVGRMSKTYEFSSLNLENICIEEDMKTLRTLKMHRGYIDLAHIPNIEDLDLFRCTIYNIIKLDKLKKLAISETYLPNESEGILPYTPNIEELYVYPNRNIPEDEYMINEYTMTLPNLSLLKSAHLCFLDKIDGLSNLNNLKILHLDNVIDPNITSHMNIEELTIEGSSISANYINFNHLTKLKKLHIKIDSFDGHASDISMLKLELLSIHHIPDNYYSLRGRMIPLELDCISNMAKDVERLELINIRDYSSTLRTNARHIRIQSMGININNLNINKEINLPNLKKVVFIECSLIKTREPVNFDYITIDCSEYL